MATNLDRYKEDLNKLITHGILLHMSMQYECHKEEVERQIKSKLKSKAKDFINKLPSFSEDYQSWYSESLTLLKQLLPSRTTDFIKLYEKPKSRKSIEYGNYVIEDYLQTLVVTSSWGDRKVGPEAAISQFEQQLNIIKAIKKRFESSLFDIKQLIQADLFDSELEAAKELNKKGFMRGAGALAGVVLEKHLSQVCENHAVEIKVKNPSIADYNDRLKGDNIYEIAEWRKIQHLADLRNLCDHKKSKEPKKEDLEELLDGVEKITKTIF